MPCHWHIMSHWRGPLAVTGTRIGKQLEPVRVFSMRWLGPVCSLRALSSKHLRALGDSIEGSGRQPPARDAIE